MLYGQWYVLSWWLHWPYLCSNVVVFVEKCHDLGGNGVYLVVGCCIAYEHGCDGLYGVSCGGCGRVVAEPV